MVDPLTYGSVLTPAWSLRSQNQWMPYDESILQAEMDRIPLSPEPSKPAQTRPAQANVAPPITGVSRDEQILQNEIAKIFGEMTFDRKKT